MKRSKMLKQLDEFIFSYPENVFPDSYDILTFLEEAGMEPPKSIQISGYQTGHEINHWELENE